jgi:hypothetical protein
MHVFSPCQQFTPKSCIGFWLTRYLLLYFHPPATLRPVRFLLTPDLTDQQRSNIATITKTLERIEDYIYLSLGKSSLTNLTMPYYRLFTLIASARFSQSFDTSDNLATCSQYGPAGSSILGMASQRLISCTLTTVVMCPQLAAYDMLRNAE